MDEVNKIRKAFFVEKKTKCQIAKKYNRSWDTVNRIIKMNREELETRGKHPSREKRVMTAKVIKAIEEYVEEEKKGWKKQKYTGERIYTDLKKKNLYQGSIRTLYMILSMLRKKHDQIKSCSFLPLDFPIGSALEIDHGEFKGKIDEKEVRGYLFVASVPGQSLKYCQIFPVKSREAWGEFHERTFHFFEGVFPRIIYDNDAVLIKKIVRNKKEQTNFSLSLEEHYQFESHFCNLGAGYEKGAVENAVGYCRRRFLPGQPSFKNWDSANEYLTLQSLEEIKTKVHYKTREKLSDLFQQTKNKLQPLPPRKTWYRWVNSRVNKCQLVTVDYHQYSVPEKFIGSSVRLGITINQIKIFNDGELIATHERQYKGEDRLELDHYLDQLSRKPKAFPYAKATTQKEFHPKLLEIWSRLSEKHGTKEATHQFVSILLLRRESTQEELIEGVEKALNLGAIDAAAIEMIINQKKLDGLENKPIESLLPKGHSQWEFNLDPYAELCKEVTV